MTFNRDDIREALRLRLSTYQETGDARPIADWICDLVKLAQEATLARIRHDIAAARRALGVE